MPSRKYTNADLLPADPLPPVDQSIVTKRLGVPSALLEGFAGQQGLPALLADPSLLREAPAAALGGAQAISNDPEQAGSMLGQLLLGKFAPEIGSAAGRGAQAVGRGVAATP